jgi:hypothetical protein
VLELDRDGYLLVPEVPEVAQLYPGDLLLGLPAESMIDQHIGSLLPATNGRPLAQLMVAGTFGPVLAVPGAPRRTAGKRSTMKSTVGAFVHGFTIRCMCSAYSYLC